MSKVGTADYVQYFQIRVKPYNLFHNVTLDYRLIGFCVLNQLFLN